MDSNLPKEVSLSELRRSAGLISGQTSSALSSLLAAVNTAIEACEEDDNCKICQLRVARDKYLKETS